MYISERLNEHHVVDSFDSGREQLDQWLKDDARRAQASGMAQVYVWREPDSQVVVGYFAITPANVAPDDLSRSVRAGYSNRIPGYLIARLAMSVTFKAVATDRTCFWMRWNQQLRRRTLAAVAWLWLMRSMTTHSRSIGTTA